MTSSVRDGRTLGAGTAAVHMSSTDPSVVTTHSDGVYVIGMNRGGSGNCLDRGMCAGLRRALDLAQSDPTVRCLVLRGNDQLFSIGEPDGCVADSDYGPLLGQLHALRMPTIAEVQGQATGIAAILAFSCDLVVASQSALFRCSSASVTEEAQQGVARLARLMGRADAMAWLILGRSLSAKEALQRKLISDCYPSKELSKHVAWLARQVAEKGLDSMANLRRMLDNDPETTPLMTTA
jgi:enoyl-CoA hydratase/carnithine racemase